MLRRLGGCAVALALLLPAQAHAAPSAPSSTSERAGAAVTKSRTVDLGHEPVRASSRDRVRLTFDGRKGQLVHLARWADTETCGRRVLKKASGATVKQWAPGYWRLPRTGTFTAIGKPCRAEKQRVKLQVRKVVQHDMAVRGEVTTIGKRSGVTHLVPVAVGTDERVGLVPSSPVVEVVGPDRRTTPGTDPAPVLREAGRHWVALEPRSTLETTLAVRRSAQVDGATIALPRMGTASTTQEVAFTGTAGQWVYAELLDAAGRIATDTSRDIRVLRPDGTEVVDVALNGCNAVDVNRGCTLRGPWLLPATGSYTMTITADAPALEQPTTLRVRAAVVAPDLVLDGPAVTYAATSPGQWVIGRYEWAAPSGSDGTPAAPRHLEVVRAAPSLGSWVVTALPNLPWSYDCGYDKACDYNRAELTPDAPRTATPISWWANVRQSWAVMVVAPDAQGSLDLSLTGTRTQP